MAPFKTTTLAVLTATVLGVSAAGGNGDDYTNNLVSDLAPYIPPSILPLL
jgi:hypothetical protein